MQSEEIDTEQMKKNTRKLIDIIMLKEFPKYFEKNESLDTKTQLRTVVSLMRKEIPVEHLSEDYANQFPNGLDIFYPSEFFDLINETYKTDKEIQYFANNLLGMSLSNSKMKKYPDTIKEKIYSLIQKLPQLLFLDDDKMKPLEISESDAIILGLDNFTKTPKSDILLNIVTDLNEKYQKNISIIRNLNLFSLCYAYFLLGSSMLNVESDNDRFKQSLFYFSLLTHHVGYSVNPHMGKWELLYSIKCDRSFGDVTSKDFKLYEWSNQDAINSYQEQLFADEYLLNNLTAFFLKESEQKEKLATENAKRKQELRTAQSLIKNLEETRSLLGAESKLYQDKTQTLTDQLANTLNMIDVEVQKRIEHYKKKNDDEKNALQKQISEWRTNAKKADKQVITKTRELREKVGELEAKLDARTSDAAGQYRIVVIHPSLFNRLRDPKTSGYVDEAAEKLSVGKRWSAIIKKSDPKTYVYLQKMFPEYDNFQKLELSSAYRAAFVEKDNKIILLCVDDHNTYEKTWGH